MRTAYISHPDCFKHDMGGGHPECAARLNAIEDVLVAANLLPLLQREDAPLATLEQLARVHTPHYIASIEAASPTHGLIYLDSDTAMNPYSWNAARRAAGAAVLAVELVLQRKVENAFCAIRPPGHHAGSARAMGFCIFNNVAVGVAHAMAKYGLQRVAIADFDVHHGNGTEQIFRDDPRVMLCSTFQHPYYPYYGADSGNDHIHNVPLPAGTGGEAFRRAVSEHWLPALDRFQPEMLFCSAGFDAHRDDDMAQLNLREADYAWVTQQIKNVADRHAQGRIVSVLEGGYELHALGHSVLAHLRVLNGVGVKAGS
ncbi:MAG: histone deacetylase family protein [Pseudomonadota bacterium]